VKDQHYNEEEQHKNKEELTLKAKNQH